MASRATRYRSRSPTPSPVPEQLQPLTTTSTLGSMTLETRGSQDNLYGGRNDLTLPPFHRNMVVGTGAPHSPRHSNYPPTYPSKDAKNYPRSNRPTLISENEIARERHHYNYDDKGYSEFAPTKPPVNMQDSEPPVHRQLPPLGNSQFANGSRSLPPPNPSTYQPNYSTSLDPQRQRQISINSIISTPSANGSNFNSFGTGAHGNGTMKKRKKSFGTENEGEVENIDSDDREREGGQPRNGDGGGSGANGNHKSHVAISVGLEDPDVRIAAEALGDLRADLNHSGISNRRQNRLQLSTTSSSNSSATNTGVNSPLSPSQPSNQYNTHLNPEEAPLLDLIQNNPSLVLRAASVAGRFSAAAYSTSKTLSPRFKYAAEHVESVAKGRIGGAVGGLVSTVGKRSGLESFVRRSLATSAGTAHEGSNGSAENSLDDRRLPPITNGTAKKRKTSGEDMEGNGGMSSTSSNLGDVPEERKALQKQPQQQDSQQQNWQTRLILSTSGIGAMSEESLKSLKYCLDWLRWANNHLDKCIDTLKKVLDEYELNNKSMNSTSAKSQDSQSNGTSSSNSTATSDDSAAVTMHNPEQLQEHKQMLMGRIEHLKGEVLKTLKKVINVVDSYAGGALVGETRNMVKRQLLHLPQRLQIALVAHVPGDNQDQSTNGSGPVIDPTATAQRVIIVAKEGLDMMHNVSRFIEVALVSAEEWCEKLGRKREPEPEGGNSGRHHADGGDVKMVEASEKKQLTENGEKRERDSEGDVKMEGES